MGGGVKYYNCHMICIHVRCLQAVPTTPVVITFMIVSPLPLFRSLWQQHMSAVLEGRHTLDDVEGVVADCLSKAEDIKQQLIVLETPLTGW